MKCKNSIFFLLIIEAVVFCNVAVTEAYKQDETAAYLQDFPNLIANSYTAVDHEAPQSLLDACANQDAIGASTGTIRVVSVTDTVSSNQVQEQCADTSKTCIIEGDLTLKMESSLKVHSLIVRDGGKVLWTDDEQNSEDHIWLCAGYVAIEVGGTFTLRLEDSHTAWIYVMNNGAVHPMLRSRSFGAVGIKDDSTVQQPVIDIQGRNLPRTWSLLESPLLEGSTKLKLLHHPVDMGWQINDRIAIAPTESRAKGEGQDFVIKNFDDDGTIHLNRASAFRHDAKAHVNPAPGGQAILQSAEVINLSRNVIITGDDFEEVPCDPSLTEEAVPGEQTSTHGCRCASYRDSCTVGLHTIHMNGGSSRIENTRVEKCGQRGIEGKYCLHFHQLEACPDCLFRNNAVEASQQRGLIVHGTHLSTSEANVFYDVRGASLYIEDGNEMANTLSYNVAICPWRFSDGGCTVPGTSNDQADTSLNQSGLYSKAPTNNLIGNRMANHFNGMFIEVNGVGRSQSYGQVCTRNTPIGRIEGNVFHSNGRFGTYLLSNNYPLRGSGQAVDQNGYTTSCDSFTSTGEDNGYSTALRHNVDYGNAFVGHYEAGDIQYSHHTSIDNLNLIYWKETKVFADGCSSHIRDSFFQGGNMALPDSLGSFIVENTIIEDTLLKANHHCTIGTTGFLCMPLYVLDNVTWVDHPGKWVTFVDANNQNNGGIFTLSPEDVVANTVESGRKFFLPPDYASLVSYKFSYLLNSGSCDSSDTLGLGERYEDGILCKSQLRVLKIFTKDLESKSAPDLIVDLYIAESQELVSTFRVPLHMTNKRKQGYAFPVISGSPEYMYQLHLDGGNGDIPTDWVIDFGDMTVSNRWGVEELRLKVQGRVCDAVVRSDHDRRFVAANSIDLLGELSWGHGACTSHPPMPETICFDVGEEEKLQPLECFHFCGGGGCGPGGYCDCHLQECACKPGWSGENCQIDLCASSQCEHGVCSARFLGSEVLISDLLCICEVGWVGSKCDLNPCQNENCGDHGTCKALSETETICECDSGWNGALCTETCNGKCHGNYPYGCSTDIDDAISYICGPSQNQCHYSTDEEDNGPSGWCTFKSSLEILPTQPTDSPVSSPTPPPTHLSTEAPKADQTACDSHCTGEWPFSCAQNLPNVVNYMCHSSGGCYYAKEREDQGPYDGFCVFKGPDSGVPPPPKEFPTAAPLTTTAPVSPSVNPSNSPTEIFTEAPTVASSDSPTTVNPTEAPVDPSYSPTQTPAEVPIASSANPTESATEAPESVACENHCVGEWPYRCAQNLPNVVNYMCHSRGGCYYAKEQEDQGPYGGFCVYKGVGMAT